STGELAVKRHGGLKGRAQFVGRNSRPPSSADSHHWNITAAGVEGVKPTPRTKGTGRCSAGRRECWAGRGRRRSDGRRLDACREGGGHEGSPSSNPGRRGDRLGRWGRRRDLRCE